MPYIGNDQGFRIIDYIIPNKAFDGLFETVDAGIMEDARCRRPWWTRLLGMPTNLSFAGKRHWDDTPRCFDPGVWIMERTSFDTQRGQ